MTLPRLATLVATGAALMPLPACSTASSLSIRPRMISGPRLMVWTTHAYRRGGMLVVHGMVWRPPHARGYLPGHLHLLVQFADGRPAATADTRWNPIPSRGSRVAAYEVGVPIADRAPVSGITASYVASDDGAASSGSQP
ncbi:MAG TPA: hypothetical protein VN137_03735 [Sphingomonas sp.]|nr:hypothetical protein [Sphingomonas sp.]